MNAAENRARLERLRAGDADYLKRLAAANAERRAHMVDRDRQLAVDRHLTRRGRSKSKGESTGERFIREYAEGRA